MFLQAITEKGGRFLEAPVSGSKKPAEDGQLIILAAEVTPAFDVLGKKSFFLGPVGNGARMKLVVNMIMGSMMNALSEGLALAGSAGLNQQTLLDVMVERTTIDHGAIANPMFKLKGPAMIKGSYPPAFPLKHQQKDMRLAAFKKARGLGLGDQDFSAVYQVLKGTESSGEQ
ncbi:Glyoxylate/succinic semialdehyde reductase 1 [Apostasia shenzhenica]|uniref:Glyoxylate/succinic semialdehyde reductase 1 n=1 Tax=Apostasia shenzhenica TaxID=1088818 RepID=A0A2I0A6T3_9ASPA|nr:Glyoxylate/succinic semialdehyde reductase 1 [Apostasia shenzhenica]